MAGCPSTVTGHSSLSVPLGSTTYRIPSASSWSHTPHVCACSWLGIRGRGPDHAGRATPRRPARAGRGRSSSWLSASHRPRLVGLLGGMGREGVPCPRSGWGDGRLKRRGYVAVAVAQGQERHARWTGPKGNLSPRVLARQRANTGRTLTPPRRGRRLSPMPPPNKNLAKQLARAGVSPTTALRLARHPDEAKALLKKLAAKGRITPPSRPPPVRVPGPSTIQ